MYILRHFQSFLFNQIKYKLVNETRNVMKLTFKNRTVILKEHNETPFESVNRLKRKNKEMTNELISIPRRRYYTELIIRLHLTRKKRINKSGNLPTIQIRRLTVSVVIKQNRLINCADNGCALLF